MTFTVGTDIPTQALERAYKNYRGTDSYYKLAKVKGHPDSGPYIWKVWSWDEATLMDDDASHLNMAGFCGVFEMRCMNMDSESDIEKAALQTELGL